MKSDQPDVKSLNASMESDKVAASRAVSQNIELKQQLEEIQQAFVQLVSFNLLHILKIALHSFFFFSRAMTNLS